MDSGQFSAHEQGTLRAAANILAQHSISFEEATNGIVVQPFPLDERLRDPTHHFSFQGADTGNSVTNFPGQNDLSTIFQNFQGQPGPGYASHNSQPAASIDFVFNESLTDHEIDQLGKFHVSISLKYNPHSSSQQEKPFDHSRIWLNFQHWDFTHQLSLPLQPPTFQPSPNVVMLLRLILNHCLMALYLLRMSGASNLNLVNGGTNYPLLSHIYGL